jgi:two-component system nitrogen regulation sensor histidine kinase NtrY
MIKNFRFSILIRLLIITVLIVLLVFFLVVDVRYLRSVYIVIFLVITLIEFVWYVDKTNRDFTAFLLALLQDDFTTKFSENSKGKSFNQLYSAFNKITKKFEQISAAKEVQQLYLEALVDHIRVGIISFDKKGKIQLMNRALQKMINRPQMAFLSNLTAVDEQLPELLKEIKPKEIRLLKVKIKNELLHLSFHASEFKLGEEYFKLVSIQNIKNELESNELDAWQKLIRVLTHEIMNSVTPITSLSGTLKQIVKNEPDHKDTIKKVSQGLEAIELRSQGLQNFTDAYRRLTRIPSPNFTEVNLKKIIDRILTLFQDKSSFVQVEIDETIRIIADKDLIEQVFINLIKNGLEALENTENPTMTIKAWKDDHTYIAISDNGTGIDPDKLDQIFIPFFTTKNEGSGIGLALSRQIVRLHNGNISVLTVPNEGTTFTVEL